MRVTKTIREYIEAEVTAIMPKTSPEEEAYKAFLDKYMAFKSEASDKLKAYAEQLCAEFCEVNGYEMNESWNIHPNSWMSIADHGTHPITAASNKAKNERVQARNQAIKDIIVALELGGTKAELDEMLKALAKGE